MCESPPYLIILYGKYSHDLCQNTTYNKSRHILFYKNKIGDTQSRFADSSIPEYFSPHLQSNMPGLAVSAPNPDRTMRNRSGEYHAGQFKDRKHSAQTDSSNPTYSGAFCNPPARTERCADAWEADQCRRWTQFPSTVDTGMPSRQLQTGYCAQVDCRNDSEIRPTWKPIDWQRKSFLPQVFPALLSQMSRQDKMHAPGRLFPNHRLPGACTLS